MVELSNVSKIIVEYQVSFEEWKSYVINHPSGTIYHLPQWKEVLEASFHYKPLYLFAKSEDNVLCGVLPLFQIKSWLTGNRLVSLPFSYICGPIVDSEQALVALINEAKNLCHALRCSYVEIRMIANEDRPAISSPWRELGFQISDHFSTHVLDLAEPDIVWKKFDSKSVRWAIRKAKKDGVIIREGSRVNDLETFYKLNLKTKRRLGVPGHPFDFLHNVYDNMRNLTKLYLAEYQGNVIAGIMNLEFKDTILYGYAASDREYLIHRPNDLLLWIAIEEGCRLGYKHFDFGKTSKDEEGLFRFKKHWGGEERKLWYYYYPQIPNSMALNNTGLKYKLATGLWQKLPLPLAQWGSNLLFKHFD
jgi:serine/alanine adding enzyme